MFEHKQVTYNRSNIMKKNALITIVLLSAIATKSHATETADLVIEMRGIQSIEGQAIFILMNSESSYHGKTPVYDKKTVPINQKFVSAEFPKIPTGQYSAVVYHDINSNGKLDSYFFGKPKEPYGFSNNARNPIGIPEFDESKFELTPDSFSFAIVVK